MKYTQAQKDSIIKKICDHILYSSHRIYDYNEDDINYDVVRSIYELHTDVKMIEQARKETSFYDSVLEENIIHVFDVDCFNMIENSIRKAVEEQKSYIY